MTTFLPPDEATQCRFRRVSNRSATRTASRVFFICAISSTCTLKRHPPSPIAFVQKLEAAVIEPRRPRARNAWPTYANEKLSERREADRQKAAAEREKAEQAKADKRRRLGASRRERDLQYHFNDPGEVDAASSFGSRRRCSRASTRCPVTDHTG